MSLLENPNL